MIECAATKIDEFLNRVLATEQQQLRSQMHAALKSKGRSYLEVHLASLPRKFGREYLSVSAPTIDCRIDMRTFRLCDVLASDLLMAFVSTQGSADLVDLYFQGDALEKRMILKAMIFLGMSAASERILQEAHRTNDEELFKAAFVDTAAPAEFLDDDDFNRGVLKCAFMNVELERLLAAATRATLILSQMLLEFMTEREAAGRKIWAGSLELAAHAPSAGLRSRVLGDLWHGDDSRRYHAVRAAAVLLKNGSDEVLSAELSMRSEVERNNDIHREILNACQ